MDPAQHGDKAGAGIVFIIAGVFLQIYKGTEGIVRIPLLAPLDPELASVIYGRDPGQRIQKYMDRHVMSLVHQFGADAFHIMVVHEIVKPDIARNHAYGTLHRMRDLKIVVIVVSAVQAFVQRVIRDAVEGIIICPAGIVSVNDFSHQPEIALHLVRRPPERLHKLKIQHVRGVQPDAVHVKFADPEADDIADVIPDCRVPLVQLGQQVVASPVVVGKTVVVLCVAPEVYIAVPVPVSGILPVCLNVLEGKEVPPGVIENSVEDHSDPGLVAGLDKVFQILVGPQAAVQQPVIRGLVSMSDRLEEGADIKSRKSKFSDMFDPWQQRRKPVYRLAVVILFWGAGKPQRIDVIKNRFVIPCHYIVLLGIRCSYRYEQHCMVDLSSFLRSVQSEDQL